MTLKSKIKEAFLLCFIQIILYGLLCINYRAVGLANYHEAAISDFVIASMNFFIIKKIANNTDSLHQWIGYTIGSVIGSYVGIFFSIQLSHYYGY